MIIDASLFAWETDLLELRLRELGDVVDAFVIVEARETTRGQPRDLVYPTVQQRYAAWRSKIAYYPVDMPGDASMHPQRRFGQFRDLLGASLPDGRPGDVIIIGDGDEIGRASLVQTLPVCDLSQPWALGMRVFYYWLNCRFTSLGRDGPGGGHAIDGEGWPVWRGPSVCSRETLRSTTPNILREGPALPLIPNGGWHFSNLMTPEALQRKLGSQGHQEYDAAALYDLDNLRAAITEGRDWDTRRNLPLAWVPIDESYPQDVRDHPERWTQWIRPIQEVAP